MAEKKVRSSIQVIERMVSLIDALALHDLPVNLKQLAEETRLHPSTAYRILNVMVRNRMIDRVEPGTYKLGLRLLELGAIVRARIGVRQESLPHMQQLHQQLGETVSLTVRHGDEVVCVEEISSGNAAAHTAFDVGARAPLHSTAAGKIFLAADGPDDCQRYAQRTGLPRCTDKTLTDAASLLREVDRVRQQGCAFDDEEAEKGVCCVSAGIYGEDGELVAGLAVSAPAERFNKAWAAQLRQVAERISRAIGGKPGHPASGAS